MIERLHDAASAALPWAREAAGAALDALGFLALATLLLRGCP